MIAMTWLSWVLLAVVLVTFLVTFLVLRHGHSEECISCYFISAAALMLGVTFVVGFILLSISLTYHGHDTGWTPSPRPWIRS